MLQLVYASATIQPFSSADLRVLLSRARARNSVYQVSGLLLYHAGSFLQVLEGPEDHVAGIYGDIERDPRHRDTKVLLRETIPRREFADWAMGFVDTSTGPAPPGLIDYHRVLPQLTAASTRAKQYLRFFQQGLCRQA